MPIRGVRSIYPRKRAAAKKMFSGTDRSQPHAALQASALKTHNSGLRSGNLTGATNRGLRHQSPSRGQPKNK